jgi:hypothetical protein
MASLAVAGCGGPSTSITAAPNVVHSTSPAEVVLAIGDEARVDALLRVGFMSVPSDSRCPTSVVCVWAGDGAAEISYGLGDGPSFPDTLHTTLDPKSVDFGAYRLTLLALTPYPSTTRPIPARDYRARLRVERIER